MGARAWELELAGNETELYTLAWLSFWNNTLKSKKKQTKKLPIQIISSLKLQYKEDRISNVL